MKRFKLSPEAASDIREIWGYIAADSVKAARKGGHSSNGQKLHDKETAALAGSPAESRRSSRRKLYATPSAWGYRSRRWPGVLYDEVVWPVLCANSNSGTA
jgi:plasmid stabilization system protein ParE